MSTENEIRDFLTTRRAKVTPERAGLPTFGRHRRVAGLRREEVALLAGISVEYYTRLERGNARGVSESVLDSVATALLLDDAERQHLVDLARTANAAVAPPRRPSAAHKIRPSIARIVDAMTGVAAMVRNGRLDLLYANDLGRALFSDVFRDPRGPNTAASPSSTRRHGRSGRTGSARPATRSRSSTPRPGRNPYDKSLTELIGELSTRSDEFRVRWALHDVKNHRSGVKTLHHPLVGELELVFEALELPADPGADARHLHAGAGDRVRGSLPGARAVGLDPRPARPVGPDGRGPRAGGPADPDPGPAPDGRWLLPSGHACRR